MKIINDRIKSIINKFPSEIGILIIDKDKNIKLEHNKGKRFKSASVIKLFILDYYLNKFTDSLNKEIKLNKSMFVDYSVVSELECDKMTIKNLLTVMIASSDNTATNILIEEAGIENINAYVKQTLGLTTTVLQRLMLDFTAIDKGFDNLTSAFDVITVLEKLYNNPLGKEIIKKQQDKSGLMRYIYSDASFYGKSGEVEDVLNDSGIIVYGDNTAYAVVLTYRVPKKEAVVLRGLCGLFAVNSNNIII